MRAWLQCSRTAGGVPGVEPCQLNLLRTSSELCAADGCAASAPARTRWFHLRRMPTSCAALPDLHSHGRPCVGERDPAYLSEPPSAGSTVLLRPVARLSFEPGADGFEPGASARLRAGCYLKRCPDPICQTWLALTVARASRAVDE